MGDLSVCLNRDDWEFAKRKLGQSVYVFLGPRPPFAVSTTTRSSSRLPSWTDSKTRHSLLSSRWRESWWPAASDVRSEMLPRAGLSEARCIKSDSSLQLSGGGLSTE